MKRNPWFSRFALPLVLLAQTALCATPTAEGDECFWNPVTRQCTPDSQLYTQPVDGLTAEQTRLFDEGLRQFRATWTVFPRADGAWGLGPYFHANACTGCHVNGGRGQVDEEGGKPVFQQLLRLSVARPGSAGIMDPHPAYDQQLQPFSIFGPTPDPVSGEADLRIDWQPEKVLLADGTEVILRKPAINISNAKFGAIGQDVMTSLRNTPALFGLGYLDAVSEEDILALAAIQKKSGYHGRPNYVVDASTGQRKLGRFGWKANQPSISQQVAAAHLGDMGITTSLFPDEDCTPVQTRCIDLTYKRGKPELDDAGWQAVNFFMTATEAPPQRKRNDVDVQRGARVFRDLACAVCHVPELKVGKYPPLPAIEGDRFHAYTDLLLHDMGAALADGRPDFQAGARDWRTAPLWGIGLSLRVNGSADLLHDGRARNVMEAILWHGGEAQASRDGFARLRREDREALIAFVNTL